jgi:hypothetical protein
VSVVHGCGDSRGQPLLVIFAEEDPKLRVLMVAGAAVDDRSI